MFLELSSIYQMDCVVSLNRVETNQLPKYLQSLPLGFMLILQQLNPCSFRKKYIFISYLKHLLDFLSG